MAAVRGRIHWHAAKRRRQTEYDHEDDPSEHRCACNEFANIETKAEGSRVLLSGKVRSWIERDLVQDAAWSAPGVTEVDNRIAVES